MTLSATWAACFMGLDVNNAAYAPGQSLSPDRSPRGREEADRFPLPLAGEGLRERAAKQTRHAAQANAGNAGVKPRSGGRRKKTKALPLGGHQAAGRHEVAALSAARDSAQPNKGGGRLS